MLLLICFALSYAILGTVEQLGHDARSGTRTAVGSVRERARVAADRRVARMRAGGPRTGSWWAWATGAATYHTVLYGVRGTRGVVRSVRSGWSTGWQRGRERHAAWLANRPSRPAHVPADMDRPMYAGDGDVRRAARTDAEPDEARTGEPAHVAYPHEPGTLYDCPGCESRCHCDDDPGHVECIFDGPHRTVGDRPDAGPEQKEPNGGAVMAATMNGTGEAPTIEQAREALQALVAEAEQTSARVDTLSASLQAADLDAQTLGEVADVLEAADAMKAASTRALQGLDSRHAQMEEAVNSTPHAAQTSFYRH